MGYYTQNLDSQQLTEIKREAHRVQELINSIKIDTQPSIELAKKANFDHTAEGFLLDFNSIPVCDEIRLKNNP